MATLTSIAVGNLTTSDPQATDFLIRLFTDAGLTLQVDLAVVSVNREGGTATQSKPVVFSGLTIGSTYYVAVQTGCASLGAYSTITSYAVVAGDLTPPGITYTFTRTSTQTGFYYTVTPTSYPPDVVAYQSYYTADPTETVNNSTIFGGPSYTPNTNGSFSFFVGYGSDTTPINIRVFVRGINSSGVGQQWFNLENPSGPSQVTVRVVSTGQYAASSYGSAGMWVNNVSAGSVGAGANLASFNPATGTLDWFETYDYPASTSRYSALVTDINNLAASTGRVIVLFIYFDGEGNRTYDQTLRNAIYAIGGSRQVFGSSNFKYCSAYILVGQGGLGQGNGLELYSGSVDNDTRAYCETTFFINNGYVLASGGSFPSNAQSDPAYGDVAATGSLPPMFAAGFTYVSATNNLAFYYSGLTVYRPDMTSESYTGGINAGGGLSSGTIYYFYPYLDDVLSSATYNQVLSVNSVAGGDGVSANAYPSFNYACVQVMAAYGHVPLCPASLSASTTSSGGTTGGGSSGGSGSCLDEYTLVTEYHQGLIFVKDVREGDLLDSPDGWVRVSHVSIAPEEIWSQLVFAGYEDEVFETTLNHPWTLYDVEEPKRSSELSLCDLIPTRAGVTYPLSIKVNKRKGNKVRLEVESYKHTFYIGRSGILTHNIQLVFTS